MCQLWYCSRVLIKANHSLESDAGTGLTCDTFYVNDSVTISLAVCLKWSGLLPGDSHCIFFLAIFKILETMLPGSAHHTRPEENTGVEQLDLGADDWDLWHESIKRTAQPRPKLLPTGPLRGGGLGAYRGESHLTPSELKHKTSKRCSSICPWWLLLWIFRGCFQEPLGCWDYSNQSL